MEEKHQKEKDELEVEIQNMLKGATSKNERKRLNKQAEQMRKELFKKQQDEFYLQQNEFLVEKSPPKEEALETSNDQPIKQPKRKPRKKQTQKDVELSQVLYDISHTKTPAMLEFEKIKEKIDKNFLIYEVSSDGSCLFRAISKCINLNFVEIRKIAADELRSNVDFYLPFTSFTQEEFLSFCNRIEKETEWGDQVVLVAISKALKIKIIVHFADQPDDVYGEYQHTIHLAFQRHFSKAGAHYNAIIPQEKL